MGDVVSLNRARKARARAGAATQAAANRAAFGRTKAEKAQHAAEVERTNRTLDDAHNRIEPPTDG